ncbi:S41 family peptidase [Pendulispora brunnea]|uniref:S41 family peptidase n=1 Tax=Pendulispora brunnea TaxID=2905690 RepID=A0ABZ2K3K5_9BACT
MKTTWVAAFALALTTCGAPSPGGGPALGGPAVVSDPTLDEMDALVRKKFYSEAVLEKVQWPKLVAAARSKLGKVRTPEERVSVLQDLLAGLHTSHTEYLPRTEPKYWELASIFEEIFAEVPAQCPEKEKRLPSLPIAWQDIGVAWKRIEGRWFVGGVFEGGPAAKAGLLLGDEVVEADAKPFEPVAAFARRQDQTVELTYRRTRGGALAKVRVVPRTSQPAKSLQEAMRASARIVEGNGARLAYVHVWSWTGDTMQQELESAIARLNKEKPSGYILDIRDGWGGAAPDYMDIFHKDVPVLVSRNREGQEFRVDAKIRVPAVVLINGGSRSGKETMAYGIKKHALAKLVGERTAGAMVAGSAHCMPDGALLYLATASVQVDGEVLEGRGVAPDVEVPFDIRYAAGRDAQLDAAMRALSAQATTSLQGGPK